MQHNDHKRTTAEYMAKDRLETMLSDIFREVDEKKKLDQAKNPPTTTHALSPNLIRDALLVMVLVSGITALAVTSTILLVIK